MKIKNIYALYKGDEFIDLGTLDYLAKLLNVKPETIRFYNSRAYKKRIINYDKRLIVIKINKENEDEYK